jgi:ergothioneine biosynthesis protein EgtC
MCRLLAYLGQPRSLTSILDEPEHSLIVQSYQPREMTAGFINADGFGIGWYHAQQTTAPFTYKNTIPIWNDVNLPQLSRYIESGCILANIRSATEMYSLSLSNCQPFTHGDITFIHNGFIHDFRHTLYRSISDRLPDDIYHLIRGSTDSEHIFGLFLSHWQVSHSIADALKSTLRELSAMASKTKTSFSANIVVSDGQQLVASRYAFPLNGDATPAPVPSLYWSEVNGIMIASEPFDRQLEPHWYRIPPYSLMTVSKKLEINIAPIF